MTARGGARIEISGVGKRYAQRRNSAHVVLQDITLTIESGEFVSLVGASGCGKTTLLRMISGLAPYYPGTISIDGQVVRGVPKRVGFVFQDAALLPWKTVSDNVAVGLNEVRGSYTRQQIAGIVEEKLGLVGLSEHAHKYPRQLSGGQQQRAGLARALVGEPELLLMDEPFGALDAFTRLRLQEELADIVERLRTTTVFVTHDVEEAVFLSDRVVAMGANPGTVRDVVDVDLPRPRTSREAALNSARGIELRENILQLVMGTHTDRVAH
jgi:ABC-type nitrate/sulfonate/bicarbonate transport system ATPase subunit